MDSVSVRYAEALFAEAKGQEDKFNEALKTIAALYKENDFKTLMNNPRVTDQEKMSVILEIINKDQIFLNFISLLIKEDRFNLICEISEKFNQLLDKAKGKITLKISSPFELSKDEIDKLLAKYKEMYKANEVEYSEEIDKSLIGGIKVTVADKIYDGTIKTKLNEML